jgi:hypothetical protein
MQMPKGRMQIVKKTKYANLPAHNSIKSAGWSQIDRQIAFCLMDDQKCALVKFYSQNVEKAKKLGGSVTGFFYESWELGETCGVGVKLTNTNTSSGNSEPHNSPLLGGHLYRTQ